MRYSNKEAPAMLLGGKIKAVQRKAEELGFIGAMRIAFEQAINSLFRREEMLFYIDIPTYSAPSSTH